MAEALYFSDLFKAKAICDDNLNAAVDAYMADPTTSRFVIGEHVADLAGAVARSPYAQSMLTNPGIKDTSKHSAVRTAILLAWPVRGKEAQRSATLSKAQSMLNLRI